MIGQEIYQLGKMSLAAKACIPLNFEHTVPRLSWQEGWVAEFWYYSMDNSNMALFEPQFYMALELPGGHPVKMYRLQKNSVCIGEAPELAGEPFYIAQNRYLERCSEVLKEEEPDTGILSELEGLWLEVQPAALQKWLQTYTGKETLLDKPADEEEKSRKAVPPENLAEYWKREMARAIREGDSEAAGNARAEMNRVIKMKRSK